MDDYEELADYYERNFRRVDGLLDRIIRILKDRAPLDLSKRGDVADWVDALAARISVVTNERDHARIQRDGAEAELAAERQRRLNDQPKNHANPTRIHLDRVREAYEVYHDGHPSNVAAAVIHLLTRLDWLERNGK